jgi:ribonuclease-3
VDLEKLESSIGYHFANRSLVEQALTHRSYSHLNYERLEFLGDSLLNFAIASSLYDKFPDASEGELSRLRARLVKQPTLAEVARDLRLGELLVMGSGELKSGGFKRDSTLSDSLEAVVGAVLLDSNVETAIKCVRGLFSSRLADLDVTDLQKDPKSLLQEFLQGRGEPVPEYELVRIVGKSPDQEFEVSCRTTKLDVAVTARGTSRRKAEQSAAKAVLELLGVEP